MPGSGDRVGPWRLVAELGSGGMGRVFLAERDDASAEGPSRVALKVLHPHLVERRGYLDRFRREAEMGRAIVHENVVRTYEADLTVADGRPCFYLVLEHVEGRSLRDLLHDLGPLPDALLREIGRQAALGLAAVHAARVVHRDVKPDNLLVTAQPRVCLTDLGVARAEEVSESLTAEGHLPGTALYAAPERVAGLPATPASDLYSLGVVLHELATGENPFRRADAAATLRAQLEVDAPRLHRVRPDVSPLVSALVASLLEKDPSRRPASAAEVARVLAEGEASAWWTARAANETDDDAGPRVPVERRTGVHGRDAERAALEEAWARALDGSGGAALVEGEAGIGKSRLVDELVRHAGSRDAWRLYGSFPPGGEGRALAAAIVGAFGEGDLAAALRPRLGALAPMAESLAAHFRGEPAPAGGTPISAETAGAAVSVLLGALAAEKPVLWVVEDLHFAGSEALRQAVALARGVAGRRALVVLTTRPGLAVADRALVLGAVARTISVPRLSPREVIRLLRDAVGSEALADRLGGPIAYKSDGIPYHVLEILRTLGDVLARTDGGVAQQLDSSALERWSVPSTLAGLVETRLAELTREERSLLDAASIVGHEFEPDLVAAALGLPRLRVLQDLAAIERRLGLVRSGAGRARFDHHVVQEVVSAAVPADLKAEIHALVAEALVREEERRGATPAPSEVALRIVRHALAGARPRAGLPWYVAAITQVTVRGGAAERLAIAEAALAQPGLLDPMSRTRTMQHRISALIALGRLAEAMQRAQEREANAREMADPRVMASASMDVARALTALGRAEEGVPYVRRTQELYRVAGETGAPYVISLVNEGAVMLDLGRPEDAILALERAHEAARRLGNPAVEAAVEDNLAISYCTLGRYAETETHGLACLELSRRGSDRQHEASASIQLAMSYAARGRAEEAFPHAMRSLEVERQVGSRSGEASANACLAEIALLQGRVDAALDHARLGIALAREVGAPDVESVALLQLGAVHERMGRADEARRTYEECLARASLFVRAGHVGKRARERLAALTPPSPAPARGP